MKEKLLRLLFAFLVIILIYMLLAFSNWAIRPEEWTGFSRVVLGFVGAIAIVNILIE